MTTWVDTILASGIWSYVYSFWTTTFAQINVMAIAGSVGATVFMGGLYFIVIVALWNLAKTGGRRFTR